jgi:predicted dehydrogenase
MEPVRWGVISCANIATRRVLPAMSASPMVKFWGIASRDLARAEAVQQQFGFERAYGSYETLLADPDIEAVYVPLPNLFHKEWAIRALRAGKHVLCEKPIGMNAAEAREMQAVARETGLILLEAFMYRFAPVVRQALDLVRGGTIGTVRSVDASFTFKIPDDPTNVRLRAEIGGGSLYDVGCYALNVLRLFAGAEPKRAIATFDWSERYKVDVGGAGLLDFGEGIYGTFTTGFRTPGNTFARVVGTEGVIELPDGFNPSVGENRILLTVGDRSETLVVRAVNPYTLEAEDICAAIRGQRQPLYAWEPLDANMRVLDACYASDKSGGWVAV